MEFKTCCLSTTVCQIVIALWFILDFYKFQVMTIPSDRQIELFDEDQNDILNATIPSASFERKPVYKVI